MFQLPDDAEALDAKIASIEEKIALCDMVFQDLLSLQRIVKVNHAPNLYEGHLFA